MKRKFIKSSFFGIIFGIILLSGVAPATAAAGCVSTGAESAGQSVTANADGSCPLGSTPTVNGVGASQASINLTYIPLEPLTGFINYQNGQTNFCSLLNGMFRLLIFLGGLMAVGSFVYAGVMYMTSEVVGTKSRAKESLQASLWGLCLLLASYIILNTINPQLISCNQALNPVTNNSIITLTPNQTAAQQLATFASTCPNPVQFAPNPNNSGSFLTCATLPANDPRKAGCTDGPSGSGALCVPTIGQQAQQIITGAVPQN
jgi:hypothetical protein